MMRASLPTLSTILISGLLAACGDVASAAERKADTEGSAGSANTSGDDGDCEPAPYQKELLTLVNAARSESRTCGEQKYAAAEPLAYSCALEQAASTHSEDMAANNAVSHKGSDGSGIPERVEAAGYKWKAVGENIAGGYSSPGEVTDGWLSSAGHCANIMNAGFTEFGAARVEADNADYPRYWTEVFAAPR